MLTANAPRDGTDAEPWSETWTTEDGQSLRMNVRTLADGATALLLEDMTRDIALARTRRAERGTLSAMLDTSPDGIAAFDAQGELMHLNGALRDLCRLSAVKDPTLTQIIDRLADAGVADPCASKPRRCPDDAGGPPVHLARHAGHGGQSAHPAAAGRGRRPAG